MTSLIKNELIKIFHKKGIYVFGIILIVILALNILFDKVLNSSNAVLDWSYEQREEDLQKYDLNNKEELEWYVDEKNYIDTYVLAKEYDFNSPEYYYIDTDISSTIYAMNRSKYIDKDEESYNEHKAKYDEQVKGLENYDWKSKVLKEKEALEEELNELKSLNIDDTIVKERIDEIGYSLKGVEYRLKNEVAPSYSRASTLVDDYVRNATAYNTMNKDESKIKDKEELLKKRQVEKEFKISEYRILNDIVLSDKMTFQDDFISEIVDVEFYFVIAMVIIAGGIFAEEFNKGTIKQLLVKPFTRTQIYVSKVIAVFIALLAFIVAYCGVVFVYELIQNGDVASLANPILEYSFKTGSIVKYNTFNYLIVKLLLMMPQLIILTLICVFAGILSTTTVGAVISVFGLEFINGILSIFLPEKILPFIPMNCWDFNYYFMYGISYYKYGSLSSSILICIVTAVILFVLGQVLFAKKDIKNQ